MKLPKIGWVRLCETLPFRTAQNCVINRAADRWFIVVRYEIESPRVEVEHLPVGVEIGIKELGVCSNAKVFASPKAYRRMSQKLNRKQRAVSHKA